MKNWTDDDPETGFFPVLCPLCKGFVRWDAKRHHRAVCNDCNRKEARYLAALEPTGDQNDPLRAMALAKLQGT